VADSFEPQPLAGEPAPAELSAEPLQIPSGVLSQAATGIAIAAIPITAILIALGATARSRELPNLTFPAFVGIAVAIGVVTLLVAGTTRDRTFAVVAAMCGALSIVATNAALYLRHYGDDSYITLRYARNLANGVGPVWNPGERVEGYTDFLWMAILAGMHKAGANLVDASMWLSYASIVLLFVAAWRIWEIWSDDAGGVLANPVVLAAILVTIAFNDSIVFWGFSGLETGMAAALLTLTALLYIHERRHDGIPFSALAASAGAMTRPELILVAAVTGAFTLRDAIERRDEKSIARLVVWTALFGVTFVPYFVWRWMYYGYIFPNTYYAKVGSSSEFFDRGMGYVHIFGSTYMFVGFAFGALALLIVGTPAIRRDAQYAIATIAAWILAVVIEGGDAFPHGRFVAPIVPLVFVTGITGYVLLLERAIPQRRQLAALGGAALLMVWLALSRVSDDPTLQADRQAHDDRMALGLWLKDSVPPDYTIAVYAAGTVPYFAELRAIDMLGLADETIAHSDVPRFGKGIPGHEKYNIDYILETRKPELIMYGDTAPLVLDEEQLKVLRGPVPAGNELIQDPRTFEMYEPAAIAYQGRWFNFLQRRDIAGTVPVGWTESRGFIAGAPTVP
jgi:arabinofuranosyltransferase